MPQPSLPIDAYLEAALSRLRNNGQLVLEAEPGAGKTTRFPLALLEEKLTDGLIIVVQPRRIAARMVAHYLADTLGESAGDTIGYQVRFEKRLGPKTRVLFMTEGMLLRRMQGDPELKGVGAVVVDEFGSAIGIITMEDIIEEVVGEIDVGYDFDEYSPKKRHQLEEIEPNVYVIDARVPISEANEVLGASFSDRIVHTMGGLVTDKLRRIPTIGDQIEESGFSILVVEATDRSAIRLRVELAS